MLFFDYLISSQDTDHILTEMRYAIALAKNRGYDLLRLSFSDEKKQGGVLLREVKRMKKQADIRFFIHATALDGNSPEARYLMNKYPEAIAAVLRDDLPFYYIIRL